MLSGELDGCNVWEGDQEGKDTWTLIFDPLCGTVETNTTSWSNYTPIKLKNKQTENRVSI